MNNVFIIKYFLNIIFDECLVFYVVCEWFILKFFVNLIKFFLYYYKIMKGENFLRKIFVLFFFYGGSEIVSLV